MSNQVCVYTTKTFIEAVQQLKNGRKRRTNRALNPKRRKRFVAKSNCETTS
jgi:hypothetical protein